jgi:tricorn protease
MKKKMLIGWTAAVMAGAISGFGLDIRDTRMLAQPAIGKTQIAFQYAGDLWTADLEGKNVRRLTSDMGLESNPAFSPDGALVAFSAQYDGNTDVFTVPAAGGVPRRLTWHPGADIVQGFTPDGRSVLFTSARASFTARYQQLFTVPAEGGFPTPLKIPNAARAVYSPDGSMMAYNPLADVFLQWKNYRGGTNSVIWILNLKDDSFEKIPQPAGRSNDPNPMWIGEKIFFRSDRNGEFNIFYYDLKSKEIKQLTFYKDFPVLNASSGNGKIVYEQAGYLHILDPQSGKTSRLQIGIATDAGELRERFARGARWIRGGAVSPSGARAVFEFRGEIVTVPAEKGDPRNLTQTSGAHERSPVWSPDGKSIAYFSTLRENMSCMSVPRTGKVPVRPSNSTDRGSTSLRPGLPTDSGSPSTTIPGRFMFSNSKRGWSEKSAPITSSATAGACSRLGRPIPNGWPTRSGRRPTSRESRSMPSIRTSRFR